MSGRYRRSFRVVGRCLIVCASLLGGAYAVDDNASAQPGPQVAKPAPAQDLTPALTAIQKSLEGITSEIKAASANPNAEEEQKREAADLRAQTRMADAAEKQIALIDRQNTLLDVQNWLIVAELFGLAVLVYLTLGTLRASIRAADGTIKAAQAAERSADAQIGVEVARLILTKIAPDSQLGYVQGWLKSSQLEAHFENYGRTLGIVTETCLVFQVANGLDPTPTYPADTITVNLHAFRAEPNRAEQSKPFRFGREIALSDDQITEIIDAKTRLWAYGYIKVLDFLDNTRVTGFCRVLEIRPHSSKHTSETHRGRFILGGPAAYSYSRIEKVKNDSPYDSEYFATSLGTAGT